MEKNKEVSKLLIRPVGIIKNKIKNPMLASGGDGINMHGERDDIRAEIRRQRQEIAEIIINEELTPTLDGIEEYSHLVVLYWAHRVPEKSRSLKKVHPMGRKEFPIMGIFCTCSPARPNPVLMTVVRLHKRENNVLKVTDLDAVDGSPVVDIKPYVDRFYPRGTKAPEWMETIGREVDQGHD